MADPISVALHAHWTPDLTVQNPQSVCVSSGTVAGGMDFHIVANYSSPVFNFGVSSLDIVEQTDVHQPWYYHSDGPYEVKFYSSPPPSNLCTAPPTKYQTWAFCILTTPEMTFSFHNNSSEHETKYVITVNYYYFVATGNYPPSPTNPPYYRVTGSISITLYFQNLVVQAGPKILKWDPDNLSACDTTFTYTISSAQKKNCNVTIDIFNLDAVYDAQGNPAPVFETTISQLCPGDYSFTWDGTMNKVGMPPPTIAPCGLYTFNIIVKGARPYDEDQMRSQIVKVKQTFMDVDSEYPGNFKFGYVLESLDGSSASEAVVSVYAPALENFQEKLSLAGGKTSIQTGSTPTDADWHFVSFSQDIFQAGGALELPLADKFYAVVSGKDDCPYNKAHLPKPFLERNQEGRKPAAALFSREPRPKEGGKKGLGYQAIEEAANQLLSGVFKKVKVKEDGQWKDKIVENAFKFNEKWKYPSQGGYVGRPIIIAQGENDYSPEGLVKALRNVDVFSYVGPGDGNAILLGDVYGTLAVQEQTPTSRHNPYPGLLLIDNAIPDGALSKLYLVVLITCKWGGYDGSPIVQKLVNEGAKFGVHVSGPKPANNPQSKQWEIFPKQAKLWSENFWKAVTKGYTENGEKVYPTLKGAVEHAVKTVKKITSKRDKRGRPIAGTGIKLSTFTYGDGSIYLGDIPLK